MTITAACSYLRNGNTWSNEFSESAGLKASDDKHAERVAYEAAKLKKRHFTDFPYKTKCFSLYQMHDVFFRGIKKV